MAQTAHPQRSGTRRAFAGAAALVGCAVWFRFAQHVLTDDPAFVGPASTGSRASPARTRSRLPRSVVAVMEPPVKYSDEDDETDVVFRQMNNDERRMWLDMWAPMAKEDEQERIEASYRFQNVPGFVAGKIRMTFGLFVRGKLEGMANVQVQQDNSNLLSMFKKDKVVVCQNIITKPRLKTTSGTVLVTGVAEFAKALQLDYNFEPLQDIDGGKYWILARSL